jgi:putative oxidoreductase
MLNAAFNLGRLIYGGFFLYNGVNHFRSRESMSQYAGGKGVPTPEVAVLGSGAMLVAGGLSVISGYKPRLGLGLVALFLAGVTPVMHRFWDIEDGQQQMSEQINFMKNTALLGSALMLMRGAESVHEAGRDMDATHEITEGVSASHLLPEHAA